MLVCLLSSPGTFSCFIVRVRGNIVYACVCKRSSSIHCVSSRCDCFGMEGDAGCVFIYRRDSEGEAGRES